MDHLDLFDRLCGSVRLSEFSNDVMKLTLLTFSLGDKVARRERNISSETISTWEECKKEFLVNIFSKQNTAKIRNDISSFKQKANETFHQA